MTRTISAATRAGVLLLALGLVASACSSSSSEPTTSVASSSTLVTTTTTAAQTTSTTTTTVVPRPAAEMPVFGDDDEPIENDTALTTGVLDNGLVYYLRANDRPGLRAELRLVVRAGSAHEQPDQSGGAHYVEHMLFNGTEKYPANDLIVALQQFGSEFGPDINAYTSWEETVYEITLPTDRPGLLESGLDVLREWATAATIDPEEVELERGVLLEEWRIRSQSFSGRYYDGVIGALLQGSPYEGHHTLAEPDVLDTTTPEALRAYYDTWYQPTNLAIVAVGDFDVTEVEQLIIDTFGDLEGDTGLPAPDLFTEPLAEPAYFVLAEPEYQQSFVELNYALPSLPLGTIGTLRQDMAFDLAWQMLVTRLEEDALSGSATFFDPSFAANPLVATQRSPGLFAYADPEDLATTAEALLSEVERALVHGFSQDELDRAILIMQSMIDAEFQRSGTTQDADFAARYVEHFLNEAPVPGARRMATLQERLLYEMTLDQVTATFRANIQMTEPFVIVVGPEDAADELPTEDDLAELLERIRTSNIDERIDTVEAIDQLMDAPEAAEIIDASFLPATSLEILTMANGVRVILFQTEIVENTLVLGGTSFGGWSLIPEEDVAEAQMVSDVVTRSGIGEHNQLSLERYLRDQVVFVTPYIDETSEGFFGRSSAEDMETLFQLLHLYVTEPRVDEVGLRIAVDEIRPYAEDPSSSPLLAAAIEMADARFGGDPRFLPIPAVEDLDTFDLDRALEVYEERFADASNFVFVVSGDFDMDTGVELARRYLGTLPSTDSDEVYADVRPPRSPGIVDRVVMSGTGELGELSLFWDVGTELDPVTRVHADLLELVMRQRLTERIREELSATYSPNVEIGIVDDPFPHLTLSITISANPDDLDTIADEVIADLEDLRDNGPTEEQMLIAQEQLYRELELFSNELLIDLLTFYLLRPAEDPNDIFLAPDRVLEATRGDLASLAELLVSLENYIQIELVPADSDS